MKVFKNPEMFHPWEHYAVDLQLNKNGSTHKEYYLFIWRAKRDFSS